MSKKINIALISPGKDVYSETFIFNHKIGFDGNVYCYYGDFLPFCLEGKGLFPTTFGDKVTYILKKILGQTPNQVFFRKRALIRSFKENKIDLVFAEYGMTGVEVMDCCKQTGIPLIVNFHGIDASDRKIIENYGEAYRSMFEYASAVIGVSRRMVKDLLNLGCPQEKISYIVYAPNKKFGDLTPSYRENAFLAVGRFVTKKAPYYTILAFSEVLKKKADTVLYMVGDGELLHVCKNIVKHLKIEENVRFLGICNHDELLPYFEKVKAFVQHSIIAPGGDSEGTPVAILEASAAALPVISTKHAGIIDVVKDGVTGFLVDEHNSHAMADKMLFLLENPDACAKMGQAGRKLIAENYEMSMHLDQLNKLINKVVSQK